MFSLGITLTKRSDYFPVWTAWIYTVNCIYPVTRSSSLIKTDFLSDYNLILEDSPWTPQVYVNAAWLKSSSVKVKTFS